MPLKLKKFIKLDFKDNVISEITNMIQIDNYFVIHDSRLNEVFVYDGEGNFKTKIGSLGSGPGEYRYITGISKGFENNIVLTDGLSGNVIVYNLKNELICNFRTTKLKQNCNISNTVFWPKKNKLYVFFKGVHKIDDKNHFIIENPLSFPKVIKTFGEVPRILAPIFMKSLGLAQPNSIVFSENNMFITDPYSCNVNVYDFDGNLIHMIEDYSEDRLTHEIHSEIYMDMKRRPDFKKVRKIILYQDVLLINYYSKKGAKASIYELENYSLITKFERANLYFEFAFNSKIYGNFPLVEGSDKYLTKKIKNKLKEGGLNFNSYLDENPIHIYNDKTKKIGEYKMKKFLITVIFIFASASIINGQDFDENQGGRSHATSNSQTVTSSCFRFDAVLVTCWLGCCGDHETVVLEGIKSTCTDGTSVCNAHPCTA